MRLDYFGGTSGTYTGFDRFGRIEDHRWRDYGASAYRVRIKHGYDRNGNRLWRENLVADNHGGGYDELYAYDDLNRLTDMDRGDLNTSKDGINSPVFAQGWDLDALGNWPGFTEDTDGDGTDDLDQSREHNDANEIADTSGDNDAITESTGSSWADPAHDDAGNMTTMPQPESMTDTYTATYDAWNRLVSLSDDSSSNTVAEYEYGGRGRRIVKETYSSGSLDKTRHVYYSQSWQALEERTGTSPDSADAERQSVWGTRYIDDLVQRKRDTSGDGTLDETLYSLADANWNVTSVVDTGGSAVERYSYTAYGEPNPLTASFGSRSSSSYGWETRYAGYHFDAKSGLHHVRHRMLHIRLGRWIQRDPRAYVDGMSLYQYTISNPVTRLDPKGLKCSDPVNQWKSPTKATCAKYSGVMWALCKCFVKGLLGGGVTVREAEPHAKYHLRRARTDAPTNSRAAPEERCISA